MISYRDRLEILYPTGTLGGECGTFVHQLAWFPPIGDSLQDKTSALNKYGNRGPFPPGYILPGDIIITDESAKYGHVAYVNSSQNNILTLTESNFHLDKRVTHSRQIPDTYPRIIGIFRALRAFTV